MPFSVPSMFLEVKIRLDGRESGSCRGLDAAGHTVANSREAEQPEAKNNLWPNKENKTVKMLSNLKLTSGYRAELKIRNGLRCAPLGQKKGLFDSRSNSATVGVWL